MVKILVFSPTQRHYLFLRWLSAQGAIMSDVGSFEISSPIVRLIILQKVIPIDRRKVPLEPPPRTADNYLDIPRIIFLALQHFDPNHIRTSYQVAYKKNRGTNYTRDKHVPSEAVYHFQVFSILQQWFPKVIFIHPEVVVYHNPRDKSKSRARDDILIKEGQTSYLLEFEASEGKAEISKHAVALEEHMTAIGAYKAWLLYFAPVNNFTWPTFKNANCSSLAIVHDDTFTEIVFYISPQHSERINL